MVEAKRQANWKVYSLPKEVPAELEANLKCLHDCVIEMPIFRQDLQNLEAIFKEVQSITLGKL